MEGEANETKVRKGLVNTGLGVNGIDAMDSKPERESLDESDTEFKNFPELGVSSDESIHRTNSETDSESKTVSELDEQLYEKRA